MGMDLMFPPDVSGWKYGDAWISSATMVERMKWSDVLFGTFTAGKAKKGGATRTLNYPVFGLISDVPTPNGLVDRLLSVFDVSLPPAKVQQLVKSATDASGGTINATNANATASAVARLVFGSPEFQFC